MIRFFFFFSQTLIQTFLFMARVIYSPPSWYYYITYYPFQNLNVYWNLDVLTCCPNQQGVRPCAHCYGRYPLRWSLVRLSIYISQRVTQISNSKIHFKYFYSSYIHSYHPPIYKIKIKKSRRFRA